ncbi:MAG: phosphoribosyl-AMP cyclohydrolase [Methanocalculus sp. MSAO_Arc1]|uniref:phosphoribosyl-AMP cyclohydrolase n=1 Tax=Methanocalculus TaxID=71151 RepID=UPI000FEE5651|nr:phosphoribosyl-AMP cyclohydrolase [Methanocalculus sp. MSAO_Arc1]RQD79127.1 MAG: phosphoribosyl-AMP cyclohydrolase [Methanocalculus sp. MSAO_Arc1]
MEIQFDSQGLVPVIAQDVLTKEILMLAYADREAVDLTHSTGYAHYYSRSRKKIWKKGEESGNLQQVHDILVDCDEDTLVYMVSQTTAACHTGHRSCFYRRLDGEIISERLFDPEQVYSKK